MTYHECHSISNQIQLFGTTEQYSRVMQNSNGCLLTVPCDVDFGLKQKTGAEKISGGRYRGPI